MSVRRSDNISADLQKSMVSDVITHSSAERISNMSAAGKVFVLPYRNASIGTICVLRVLELLCDICIGYWKRTKLYNKLSHYSKVYRKSDVVMYVRVSPRKQCRTPRCIHAQGRAKAEA